MSPPVLHVEKHKITTTTHGFPTVSPVNKYMRSWGKFHNPSDPCIILVLSNGAGFSKEIWEPTILDLFEFDDNDTRGSFPSIREVWVIDCQNHGEGYILNEDILVKDADAINIWDYADAMATLFKSGLFGDLNPALHKVVMGGHSAGCVALVLGTSWFNPPSRLPFASLLFVEPGIYTNTTAKNHSEVYKLADATTPVRRDIWKSESAAAEWMIQRPRYLNWDRRVFDIYLKYGLRPLPTLSYPDKTEGVTLTTHRLAENFAFTGAKFMSDCLNRLNQICKHIPIHLIYGSKNDMFSREAQDALIDADAGRTFASVIRIDGAGHLLPQEKPRKLAAEMLNILKGVLHPTHSKL